MAATSARELPADTGARHTRVAALGLTAPVRYSIYLVALVAGAGALYIARELFVPITLAFLLALILSPIVRSLRRRGISHVLSAAVLVTLVAVGLIAGLLMISAPAAQWLGETPQLRERIENRLQSLRIPVEAVNRATESVEDAAQTGTPAPEVVVRDRSLFARAADNIVLVLVTVGLMLLLTFFILASSDLFYSRLIALSPTLTQKKNALGIVRNIERDVSQYLLAITIINIGFGAWVGSAMWFIGLPSPLLWGAAAAMLNFMPYVGPFVGTALVTTVALVSFESLAHVALAPIAYLALTAIEGGFVTPIVLQRRLALNTVAIFIAISFWGWLWGIVGLLIAVPLLLVTKVICDNVEAFAPLGNFLSAEREAEPVAAAASRLAEPSSEA